MTGFVERFEYATADDPYLNYCLWNYPAVAPGEDKFRSINLLLQSFDLAGIDPRACDIVEAIRDEIGPFRTVFGVKYIEGRLGWEFYFYDYRRRERDVSISRVLGALRSLAPCEVQANENLPYFMFSLDLNHEIATGRSGLDVVHMYIGNPGSTVSSGVAYGVRKSDAMLENYYFFFDAGTQLPDVAKKVVNSAWFDDTVLPVTGVMWPELVGCRTICVANKQTHDCIYFSGVDVGQLLWFLRRLSYPIEIVKFVEDNRHNLDHLLFDVGYDYRMEDGSIRVLKSGYYGVF